MISTVATLTLPSPQAVASVTSGAFMCVHVFDLREQFLEPAVMVAHIQLVQERWRLRVTSPLLRRGTEPSATWLMAQMVEELWSMTAE